MNVLVTGGAGFIGSHSVETLLAAGAQVTVLDNFSNGRRVNLPAAHPALRIVEGDIRDLRAVAAVQAATHVLHISRAGLGPGLSRRFAPLLPPQRRRVRERARMRVRTACRASSTAPRRGPRPAAGAAADGGFVGGAAVALRRVIGKWAAALAAGAPLRIFGDGLQTRDFVYLKDVARVNLLAL